MENTYGETTIENLQEIMKEYEKENKEKEDK